MDSTTLNSILQSLELTLGVTEASDIAILTEILNNAMYEIQKARRYPLNMSQADIDADMENYISNVKHLASYDYSRIGAEGEDSHSENGINRSYDDRAKCFYGVLPFAKMF